jgi:hypothetical protein
MMLSLVFAAAMMTAEQGAPPPTETETKPVEAADPSTAKPDEDSPEEIAKDAARDLKDSRFYNRPGATRAEYDAAWQECRLIARGSRTPSGTYTYVYNPNVISPVAAGIGAGIGGLIGNAIVQGQIRRANRRSCLLVKGWRLVEVEGAEAAKVTAMTDAERDSYFGTIIGAVDLGGKKITTWTNDFAAPRIAPVAEQ